MNDTERPDDAPEMRTCPTCASRIPADEECGCDEPRYCDVCADAVPVGRDSTYCSDNCWFVAGAQEAV